MNKAKLKPCPFCGGAARSYNGPIDGYGVVCTKCGVKLYGRGSIAAATRAWNRRSPVIQEAMKVGYECGRADATSEIFVEIDEAIHSHYHSYTHKNADKSLIIVFNYGARTSIVALKRDIDELRKKYTNGGKQ